MSPIASCAKNCLGLFEDLVELLRQPAHQDDYRISDTEITDAFGRFKIWAGNIGAFQQIDLKSSLDFRLRDTPKISTQILEILDDLAESLEDACSIASESRENRKGASLAHIEETQDNTDGPRVQSEEEKELSEIREIFGSIQDAINNLFRYSIIIRNNTNRDRYAKAAAAAISSPFSNEFDIQHVRHKFPALQSKDHEWLIERLGKAITQRRQYLRYCRSHHDKTWQEPSSKVGPDVIRSNEQKPQASMRPTPSSRSDFSKPTSTLAPTQASTLFLKAGQVIEEEGIEESQSQTSYATSTDEESNNHVLRVIQLEDVSKGLSHFECPYCWQIQTCRNQKAWKKHVLSDLKPYVCTFEGCELKLFFDRQTWFSHELKDHRKEWNCHFCAHFPFDKAAAYHAHLTGHHPHAFTEDQLPALFDMSQKPLLKISPTDCPFCDDWEDRLRAINSHIPAEESLVVTPSQFQHHVGAHMVQLALFAIPRGYTEEGEADSANAIPQIESDDSSLGDNPPDLVTAEQFRKCEDILDELIELGRYSYPFEDMRQFHFPAFSASIPYFGRTVIVSPVDFPQISQKLQTGVYSDINAFCLDLVLFFAIIHLRNIGIRQDHHVMMAFHRTWRTLEGNICPSESLGLENLIYQIERQIQWSLWRANEFPPELGADTREACRIRLLLKSGGTVERRFSKSAALEEVYAFVECYELIKDGSPLPQVDEPIGYIPKYNFKLGSIIAPKYHLDLQMGTVGDLLGNFADLMVVDLQKGEEPQTLSRTKRRSLSPISEQTPRIDSTTSMPRDNQVSTSGNDEFAMPQSPGASSTRNSGSYSQPGASILPSTDVANDELASIGSLKGESIGPRIGTLTVLVHFARNLQPRPGDSYCKVLLGAACRVTKKDSLAGGTSFWDEAFHFSGGTGSWSLMGQKLEVHVLNGDGTLIGNTPTIDLRTIGENIQEGWHKLYRVNQIAGEIRLGLMFLKDKQLTSDSPTGHIDSEETTLGNLNALEQIIKQVETKEFWEPEEGVKSCPSCGDAFSVFRRKQHCRTCGHIFDFKCLTEFEGRRIGIEEKLLVCKTCLDIIEGSLKRVSGSRGFSPILFGERGGSFLTNPESEAGPSKQPESEEQLPIPIYARIPRYCFAEDKFSFVVEVKFKDGRRHWELSRYYEDFYDFQIALLTTFPIEAGSAGTQKRTLPYMPGPVSHVTDAITERRTHDLEKYVKALLSQPSHISRSTIVRRFFAPREGDNEIGRNSVNEEPSGGWDMDTVLSWLRSHQFSTHLENIFVANGLYGSAFLWLGNYVRKGAIDPLHIVSRSAPISSFEGYAQEEERLRLMIREILRKGYSTTANPISPTECAVIQNYTQSTSYEVDLIKGEVVTVVEKGDLGWWRVQTAVAEGWVPEANLVEGLLLDQPFHKSLPAPSPLSKKLEGSSAHEPTADDSVQQSNLNQSVSYTDDGSSGPSMVAGMDKENLESSSARGSLEEERQTAEQPQLEFQRTIQEHRRATESYQPSEDANSPERSARYPIGDLLKDFTLTLTKDKRNRLPPGFMPQLENQMEGVISGKETLDEYSDVFLRRSFAEAYTTFNDRAFRRQMDKDRRADDLILVFHSQATKALQREYSQLTKAFQRGKEPGSSLELPIDRHIARFVRVICNTLTGYGNDNLRELMEQLMTLERKLLANDQFRLLTNYQENLAKGKANVNSGGFLALRRNQEEALRRIEIGLKEVEVAGNKYLLTMEGNDGDLLKLTRQAMMSREDNENNDESPISCSGDTSA